MPAKNVRTPILPNRYYHIFNRGNNFENIFLIEEDYQSFLKKFKFFMRKVCDVFAYSLLPNHYHFMLRIGEDDVLFLNQLRLFILEYTHRINSREGRHGNLFLKPFRRLEVTSDEYFSMLIYYIHFNPVKHGISGSISGYEYSSYQSILSEKNTVLARDEVLEWFGGKDEFIDFHNGLLSEDLIEKLIIE